MSYIAWKHMHVTFVSLSVILFALRFLWLSLGTKVAQQKWVKIVPHIIDTLLIISIIGLMSYRPWDAFASNKLLGLVVYILAGVVAMKASKLWLRNAGFVVALGAIGFLLHVAFSKQALIG
jgi:uncharacterized membrane protein SirB2